MSLTKIKQQALRFDEHSKRDVRTQFGALCWRRRGNSVEVLLVTSRRRKRWILPKGWPVNGATPVEAAVTEAWEEAGIRGKAKSACLGIFSYSKDLDLGTALPCVVAVFPVKVESVAEDWPEKTLRRRRWLDPKKAAEMVEEPELAAMLRKFDPEQL